MIDPGQHATSVALTSGTCPSRPAQVIGRDGGDVEAMIAEVAGCSFAAPVVGGRHRRDALRPLPGRRRAAHHRGEGGRRRRAQRADRGQPHASACTCPGTIRRIRPAPRPRRGTGIGFDAMNSNTFQDNPSTTGDGAISYKFGFPGQRRPRRAQARHRAQPARSSTSGVELGRRRITVWFADGTNHPGQASFRGQFERVADGLQEVHGHLPGRLAALHRAQAVRAGVLLDGQQGLGLLAPARPDRRAKARCLVDLGHHLPNVNIEQVVAGCQIGRLGGFHFNDSKYGDDDLTVGSIQPYRLFLDHAASSSSTAEATCPPSPT